MGILDRKPAALSAADIERVVQRAVEEALAKTHDTPDMPRQPARQSPRTSALLRSLSTPAPVPERPAAATPAPAPPKKFVPSTIFFERAGDGLIRTASFTLPDGRRCQTVITRDANDRIETLVVDGNPDLAWRVRHDAYGQMIALVPLSEAPPLRTADGDPVLPAPINR